MVYKTLVFSPTSGRVFSDSNQQALQAVLIKLTISSIIEDWFPSLWANEEILVSVRQ